MILEDRIITTDMLKDASVGIDPWCQVGIGVLERLDPVGTHVLIAVGPLLGEDEPIVRCCARLRLADERQPLEYQFLLPVDEFVALPTAFDVLVVASDLAQGVASEVEAWLAG